MRLFLEQTESVDLFRDGLFLYSNAHTGVGFELIQLAVYPQEIFRKVNICIWVGNRPAIIIFTTLSQTSLLEGEQ